MMRIADVLLGSLKLLLGTGALCFVAAMPVSLDLAATALTKLC